MAAPLGQVDFGADVSSMPDLDPSFAAITGTRVIAEAVARRLMTPRGALPDAPKYGTDIRLYLNESIGTGSITVSQIKNAIEAECLQDERIQAADAAVLFDPSSGTMNITIALASSSGPFKLVLTVTALTITLLNAG